MVVDKRDGGDRLLVLIPLLPDQAISNQIADGLGATGIFSPLDQAIEIHKEVLVE